MKFNILITLLFFSNFLFSQTKEETIEFLKNKIQVYQLETDDTQHVYAINKDILDDNKLEIFHRIDPMPYYYTRSRFDPKDFLEFVVPRTSGPKWLELHFKNDKVKIFVFNTDNDERNPTTLENKITFIFGQETPENEFNKIKKALKHLFELYGYKENSLFKD